MFDSFHRVLVVTLCGLAHSLSRAVITPTIDPTPRWEPMTETQLHSVYFDYELCVLRLPPEQYYYNHTIFNQPACTHHLPFHHISSPSSAATSSNLDKVNDLQSVHKRCWFGAKQQRQDDGLCIGKPVDMLTESEKNRYASTTKERKYCVPLKQRLSFWNHWSHIPENVHPPDTFLRSVLNLKFELVSFNGDSMSLQLAQRLLCQLLRRNVSSVQLFGDFFSVKSDGGVSAKINLPSDTSESSSLMVMFKRNINRMGCTDLREHQSGAIAGATQACGPRDRSNSTNSNCIKTFQSEYIFSHTLKQFNSGEKWGNTLHIYMLPIRIKHSWEYVPYAKALLMLAKANRKFRTRILVLSPFAQHFLSDPLGLYDNFTKPTNMLISVCGPHTIQNVTEHPEMTLFKEAIQQVDSYWQKYIGTFDLLAYSRMMHDLHPETHSTGWSVDCTHFLFQPVMMDAVWLALSQYLDARPLWTTDL